MARIRGRLRLGAITLLMRRMFIIITLRPLSTATTRTIRTVSFQQPLAVTIKSGIIVLIYDRELVVRDIIDPWECPKNEIYV